MNLFRCKLAVHHAGQGHKTINFGVRRSNVKFTMEASFTELEKNAKTNRIMYYSYT